MKATVATTKTVAGRANAAPASGGLRLARPAVRLPGLGVPNVDPSDQRADAGLGELLERAARAQEETRRLLVKLQQSQAQLAAIQAEMAFRSRCGGEWPSPMPPLERGGSTSDEQ